MYSIHLCCLCPCLCSDINRPLRWQGDLFLSFGPGKIRAQTFPIGSQNTASPVFATREEAKPEPKDNQVLAKGQSASANALDYRGFEMASIFDRLMYELLLKAMSKVLGADIAGRVEVVGASVKPFQPGDEVLGVSAGSVGGIAGGVQC